MRVAIITSGLREITPLHDCDPEYQQPLHNNEIAQARRRCERSLGLRIDASEVGVLHCEAGREHGVVIFVIIRFNVIIIIERSIIN